MKVPSRILPAVLMLLSSAASAQIPAMPFFEKGMSSAGLLLGSVRPTATDGFDRAARSGPGLGVQYLYYPWDWAALGAELDYLKFGKGSQGSAEAKVLSVLARVNLLQERSWTPFVTGGVGYHLFDLTASVPAGTCAPLLSSCDAGKGSSAGLATTAGGGVEAFLFRGMSLSLETRWQGFDLDPKKFSGRAEALSILVGARFWFGLVPR